MIVPLQMELFDEKFSVVVFHLQSHYIFQRYRVYFSVKWWFFLHNQLYELNKISSVGKIVLWFSTPNRILILSI